MSSKFIYSGKKLGACGCEIQIFVEGADEEWFVEALLKEMNVSPERVAVIGIGGKDKIVSVIDRAKKSPDFSCGLVKKVGVILDADDNPGKSLRNIQVALRQLCANEPGHGEVVEGNNGISVGAFVIPSSTASGCLETLCLSLLPEDGKVDSIKTFMSDFERQHGIIKKSEKKTAKIFLALTTEDTFGVGRGFSVGAFGEDMSNLLDLRKFLEEIVS